MLLILDAINIRAWSEKARDENGKRPEFLPGPVTGNKPCLYSGIKWMTPFPYMLMLLVNLFAVMSSF